MLYLPLGAILPGNVDTPGTMAYNVRHNQLAVREAIFGRSQEAKDQAENPQARALMNQADAAVAAAKYDLAISSYEKLITAYAGTPLENEARVKLGAAKVHIGEHQQQRRSELLERYHRVEDALKGGRDEEARILLGAFSRDEREELKAAGTDVGNLDDRLAAIDLKRRDEGFRQRQRDEAKGLLEKGRQQMTAQQFAAAQATFESIANKYPAEYLPAGVKLADLIAEARSKAPVTAQTAAAPPKDPEAVKAQAAWDEVKRLEGQRKFDEAVKKCQELQALPDKYQPQGLAEKIDALKAKAKEKHKAEFFGT
jgi:hypothetical protein